MGKKLKIRSKDKLVHEVIRKFDERSAAGFAKYGSTLRDDMDDIHRWFNDVQEELMDAILYIQKVKEVSTDLLMDGLAERYLTEDGEKEIRIYDAKVTYNTISSNPEPQDCTLDDCCGENFGYGCKFNLSQ